MFFEASKKTLLTPLKLIAGVVEQRQTLPILANMLVQVKEGRLHLTATDAEVEIACSVGLENYEEGETTIPARKFFDICRSLGDKNPIQVRQEDNHIIIKAGKSRFSLSTLPAADFPVSAEINSTLRFNLSKNVLKGLFSRTQFAMAQQDVRYYLNGLLLDVNEEKLSVVATDGHRLALASSDFSLENHPPIQVIVPRKAVIELSKMLDQDEEDITIALDNHHIKVVVSEDLTLSSKLIDGRFPDYYNVLLQNPDKIVVADCHELKQALTRAAILSNEKYKGVRLLLENNMLRITASNPEQEEAEEELEIDYSGESLEIGFNVTYLLDALSAITTEEAVLCFVDSSSSCLLKPQDDELTKYVVMPMRL